MSFDQKTDRTKNGEKDVKPRWTVKTYLYIMCWVLLAIMMRMSLVVITLNHFGFNYATYILSCIGTGLIIFWIIYTICVLCIVKEV